jgi:hypothetical protein
MIEKKKKIFNGAKVINEKYGHLIPYDLIEVPLEHRHNKDNIHSLRCFKKIYQRDKERNKLLDLPKVRCKKHVEKGYLFCKFHGGRKNDVITYDKDGEIKNQKIQIYKNVYNLELGTLIETFINDPGILDLKPELGALRGIMINYIKQASKEPDVTSKREALNFIREILYDDEMKEDTKFNKISEMINNFLTITSPEFIDRVNKTVDVLGKTIERIRKYETKDDFLMSPEGLKLMLRALVDLLDDSIENVDVKKKIVEGLYNLSTQTKGDISSYKRTKYVDAEVIDEKK